MDGILGTLSLVSSRRWPSSGILSLCISPCVMVNIECLF